MFHQIIFQIKILSIKAPGKTVPEEKETFKKWNKNDFRTGLSSARKKGYPPD